MKVVRQLNLKKKEKTGDRGLNFFYTGNHISIFYKRPILQ